MSRIKLELSYDGTNYHGWQKQNNAVTIQETLERSLCKIYKTSIETTGASRTDTGVHAKQQVVTFQVPFTIPSERLPYALNANLPPDIVVYNASEVPEDFHPRYHAVQKTYSYTMLMRKFMDPMLRNSVLFVAEGLDIEKMQYAANQFVGTHDFSAFRTVGSSVKSSVRTIYKSELTQSGEILEYHITGDGFLYNMVRIIVGTLIEVGRGNILAEEISEIIASKDRNQAGKTAPPQGLCLEAIYY